MKIIGELKDFNEVIQNYPTVICFVDSPWSWTSVNGRDRFKELSERMPMLEFITIDNESADSFIYNWLKDQESSFRKGNVESLKGKGSWIHGHGELVVIRNSSVVGFEKSIYNTSAEELEKRIILTERQL